MLDNIRHHTLSPTDAAKWLHHVVTEEINGIKRNRAIVFAGGGSDPRADWSMAEDQWSRHRHLEPKPNVRT